MAARDPLFVAMELDVYQPVTTVQPYAYGRGNHPRAALTVLPQTLESTDTLRASDQGYRSRAADSIGLQVYPAVLNQAFEINRQLALDPASTTSSASFGSVVLSNLGQRYDGYVLTRNSDSRTIKLLLGQKTLDTARSIYVDPPYASLTAFFGGFASPWKLSEEQLEIPIQDTSAWADRPLQNNLYLGLGGVSGSSTLASLPIPITRGGTSGAPVQNVPLTTVDPVSLIYQWTDGPGTVVTLYEGGAAVFTYDGNVADLYSGTAPVAGHYRTSNTQGLLQLGSSPVRALTADVTGQFPTAGVVTTAALLALNVLTETMALPTSLIDTASFTSLNTSYPYTAGFYTGTTATSGLAVVQKLLGSVGARMISGRDGRIKAIPLLPIATGTTPALAISGLNAVSVTPQALPSALDPPPFRWRVGYLANYSIQTSDFNAAVTATRKTFLAQDYRLASWSGSDVLTAWRRPSDPAVVGTYLLVAADAQALANNLGALWHTRPEVYAVEVPMDVAATVDVGSIVSLTWPLRALGTGALGRVVGEQIRSYDATCTFMVLMT